MKTLKNFAFSEKLFNRFIFWFVFVFLNSFVFLITTYKSDGCGFEYLVGGSFLYLIFLTILSGFFSKNKTLKNSLFYGFLSKGILSIICFLAEIINLIFGKTFHTGNIFLDNILLSDYSLWLFSNVSVTNFSGLEGCSYNPVFLAGIFFGIGFGIALIFSAIIFIGNIIFRRFKK